MTSAQVLTQDTHSLVKLSSFTLIPTTEELGRKKNNFIGPEVTQAFNISNIDLSSKSL